MKLLNRFLNIFLGDYCIEIEAVEEKTPINLALPEKIYIGSAKRILYKQWWRNFPILKKSISKVEVTFKDDKIPKPSEGLNPWLGEEDMIYKFRVTETSISKALLKIKTHIMKVRSEYGDGGQDWKPCIKH